MARVPVGQVSRARLMSSAASHSTASTNTTAIIVPTGADVLVICISSQSSNDANLPITGVTFNGSATGVVKALEKAHGTNDTCASVWYLLAPTVGTYDVVVTSTGSVFKAVVCSVWTGVIQQAPEVTASSAGTAASVSQAITPLTNFALLIDCASHQGAYTSVASGQALVTATETGQSFEHCTSSYKIVGAAVANTIGQTWASSQPYSYVAISFAATVLNVPRVALTRGTDFLTGSYVGTGVDNLVINPGFQPDLVIIKGDTTQNAAWRSSSHSANSASFFLNVANGTTTIKNFTSTGFTLGTAAHVNSAGITYHYSAFKIDPATTEFAVGTYTGTGAAKIITGLGFQPDFVLTKGSSTTKAIFRDSIDVGDVSHYPDGTANGTDQITSLDTSGFSLGTHADVNGNAVVYYWFAFKQATGRIKVSSYTGNNTDNTDITGVGFMPRLLLTKKDGASSCCVRMSTYIGDKSSDLSTNALAANRIQAFITDGFNLGQDSSVNSNAIVYHYIAIFSHRNRTVSPARTATPF